MQFSVKQLLESCERVLDFLVAYPPPNPPAKYAERKAELEASVARVHALASDASSGRKASRDMTARQQTLARRLRQDHLLPISRIAKALLGDDPVIQQALKMPDQGIPYAQLAAEAEGMRKDAAEHEQVFVDNGRPADFLARLDAAVAELREALMTRERTVRLHVGANKAIRHEVREGRRIVAMLDAFVQDAFAGDVEVLARWRSARRVKLSPVGGGSPATGGTADETRGSALAPPGGRSPIASATNVAA